MQHRLEHLPADVLGLPDVARAALAGRPRPPRLPGMVIPGRIDELPAPPALLDHEERSELARTLEAELARHEPHVHVLESARALAQPGAALVVAGQQPAFLGGPLYDVCKAVHAIRLARALTEAWGRPVLPAFWNHADDHDVAEVHHLWLQNSNLDLFKLGLASMSSGRVPFGSIVLDEERHRLGSVRAVLGQNLWQGESADRALELFVPRAGETFAGAFTRTLLGLLGQHGLLVIEPDWIRGGLSHALAGLVGGDLHAQLADGSARLRAHGLEPAIDPEQAALVFRLREGERHALRLARPDQFAFDDEPGSRSGVELAAEIVQEPAAWSAGALLRPLVQDRVLPVAAYVGGWGELGYHAQLPPLRAAAGLPATPFVPRLSMTLVDPETDLSLAKLGLDVRAVLAARGDVAALVSGEEEAAPPVLADLRGVAERAAHDLAGLRGELEALDRGLAAQIQRTASQVRDTIERLAQKAERVHANRSGRGRRHLRRIENGLYPRGLPQERVRGALEFVARFGPDWIDDLVGAIEPLPTEHVVVHLDDAASERGPRTP